MRLRSAFRLATHKERVKVLYDCIVILNLFYYFIEFHPDIACVRYWNLNAAFSRCISSKICPNNSINLEHCRILLFL